MIVLRLVRQRLWFLSFLHLNLSVFYYNNTIFPVNQLLVDVLKECLVESSKRGYNSIAFPPIGCGNWKYPVQEVAHCFAQASKVAPNTKVGVVKLFFFHL